jgi:alginate O-acetyltransferase complex protein AlgI
MTFASAEFLLLFLAVSALYHVTGHRVQNLLLLAASYLFYGWWDWRFLGLLFGSSVVDYVCGRLLDSSQERGWQTWQRQAILAFSILVNLGALAFFKYFNFFLDSVNLVTASLGHRPWFSALEIVLPVGISFIAFQSMSYTIDVYRRELPAERNFFDFLLYLSFFPQLVAGPIERASRLLPQIKQPRQTSLEDFGAGLHLALWGLFKKVVIADNLAPIVGRVFDEPAPGGFALLLGCYAFAFQIYCDFSGYTDIARGVARTLGFDLMVNFQLPYLATSPSEFWQRWHISLSTWLKDYLYIPLGGNRLGVRRTLYNLMIVMILGGLWHGAAWHFVAWGVYQGLLLVIFQLFRGTSADRQNATTPRSGIRFWLSVIGFFQLTCVGWLIFRVDHLSQLVTLVPHSLRHGNLIGLRDGDILRMALLIIPFAVFELYYCYFRKQAEPWAGWRLGRRVGFNLAMIYGIVLLAPTAQVTFIYFQF